MNNRDERLQAVCRSYLRKLRYMAKKHGLGHFIDDTIRKNLKKECSGTQKEVEMLARTEIPEILGKSYRECCDKGLFDSIKKLRRVGTYSKVSALRLKEKKG